MLVSHSRAVGGWREGASTRFMEVWRQFLEHEDAPLDPQYGTAREVDEVLVERVGRTKRKTYSSSSNK